MATPGMFRFCTVARKSDTRPIPVEVPWDSFALTMANTAARNNKDGAAWLPATFKGNGRTDADVEAITACVLDIDHGNVAAEHIAAKLDGYSYIAHTTYSSTAVDRRWRIAIPLTKPVAPTKTSAMFEHFNKLFAGQLDSACKNPSRIHYLPACPSDALAAHEFVARRGATFDGSKLADTPITSGKAAPIAPATQLPERFGEGLQSDNKLRLVWEGADTGLSDPSRSGHDMQLAAMLVNREYTDPEIAALMLAFAHGKAQEAGAKYIAHTINKARRSTPGPTPEPATDKPKAEDNASQVIVRRVADIQVEHIHWLWIDRIARGKLSLIVGDPGQGKSQISASIAAVTTTGGTFPDGTKCEPGNVIILSAEDDAADTLKPRLAAARADMSRVYILDAVRDKPSFDASPSARPFNLGRDIPRLEEAINQIGGAALVVIDPLSAYLGTIDSHRNSEVRALLMPLGTVAAKLVTAIVGVTHLSKSGDAALMRVMGSLAFVAAARAAFVTVAAKDNPEKHLFLPLKNNIGRSKSGFAYSIESISVEVDGMKIETSLIVWGKDPIAMSADEAMAKVKQEPRALADAKSFLMTLLRPGPLPAKEIKREAEDAGHSWAAVRRAYEALGVSSKRESSGNDGKGKWIWQLKF